MISSKRGQDLEDSIRSIWEKVSQEISERFGLIVLMTPSVAILDPNQMDVSSAFGHMDEGVIYINSQFPELERLLPPIVAKFCFQKSLPSDLLCGECIDDLSFEFARQRIKDDGLMSRWESVWAKHSPRRKISSVITYDPVEAYTWLFSIVGKKGLSLIVRELTQRVRNQISLTFEDYLLYFAKRFQSFENSLTTAELKVIGNLLEKPGISFTEISQLTGLSKEWVSRKTSELKERKILRKFARIPVSKVGIEMFQLLMKNEDSEEDVYRLLEMCPFLYSFRRVVSGSWTSFATLCIPSNSQSLHCMNTGLELISKSGIEVDIVKIHSSGVSYCFDYYDVQAGKWDLPWELLSIQLRRIKLEDLASAIPRVDTPLPEAIPQLDELDMRIFDCIRRGIVSSVEIRKSLSVGQNKLLRRLKNLRANGVLQETWEIHNIGLVEHVVIHSSEKDTAKAIAGWSRRLPRCVISFSKKGELLLMANLPIGGSYGLASALEEMSSDIQVGDLSTKLYGSWGFPQNLWDYEFNKWKCPEKKLDEWISELR